MFSRMNYRIIQWTSPCGFSKAESELKWQESRLPLYESFSETESYQRMSISVGLLDNQIFQYVTFLGYLKNLNEYAGCPYSINELKARIHKKNCINLHWLVTESYSKLVFMTAGVYMQRRPVKLIGQESVILQRRNIGCYLQNVTLMVSSCGW